MEKKVAKPSQNLAEDFHFIFISDSKPGVLD
jgi:hypothetical protein